MDAPSIDSNSPPQSLEALVEHQVTILQAVSRRGDYELDANALAHELGEDQTLVEYHLDKLVSRGFLHDSLSYIKDTRYGLTEAGRSYLVESNLL